MSKRLLVAGGAYVCLFEMPFNHGARVELHNPGAGHCALRRPRWPWINPAQWLLLVLGLVLPVGYLIWR